MVDATCCPLVLSINQVPSYPSSNFECVLYTTGRGFMKLTTASCASTEGGSNATASSRVVHIEVHLQGERLSHAVGCAFAVCLERKQKRDKDATQIATNRAFRPLHMIDIFAVYTCAP